MPLARIVEAVDVFEGINPPIRQGRQAMSVPYKAMATATDPNYREQIRPLWTEKPMFSVKMVPGGELLVFYTFQLFKPEVREIARH